MDSLSKSQQTAIPSTSFSDQFNVQFSESLSKYKRARPAVDSSDFSSSESSDDDSSSSTGDEAPEYVSNGQGKEWEIETGKQLQQALEVAVLLNAKDEEAQLHREIAVFRNFVQLGYFEAMELYSETNVDLIRSEITDAANETSHLDCIGDIDSFLLSSTRPSSSLSFNLASVLGSFLSKILKTLPKPKRIAKAVTAVREGSSMREAAALYGVNRQTVANRISGKFAEVRREDRLLLTIGEEAALLRFVDQYVALGFPPRLAMLKEKAVLLLRERGVEETPGINWPRRFLRRYPAYDSKFPRHLDQERHWNSESVVMSNWFDLYDRTCLKYGIATGDQYNMDEKGYLMGIAGAGSKVIVRRSNRNTFSVHSGDRTWATTLEFISSRGRLFHPLVIFRGKKIQKSWTEEWPRAAYAVSENGWTDNEAGLEWLKNIFHPQTVNLGGRRFLLIDGHESHVSVEFIEFCWTVDIVPLCLPPHTTHYFQPLDVGCFGPLIKAYKKQLDERNKVGIVQITKLDFLTCLQKARSEAMTADNIMSAWAATGLYPFDPQRVLEKLPQEFHRSLTPPSGQMFPTTRTPKTSEEMVSIVKSLNPYSPNHKPKLTKVLKAINIMQADLLITRDSTRNLFKANMHRESRKKKKSSGNYGPGYDRVLTEAEATRHREDEAKKAELTKQKKELAEAKKLATVTKKLDAEAMRQNKRAERAEKTRIRDEMKAMKAAEVIGRKRKREEEKIQKELERASRPKRVYRKRLREPSNQENPRAILVDPALEVENTQARSPTPSMGGYVYPTDSQVENV